MKSLNLTYLEFYSGVGGWTLALNEAKKRINRKRDIHMTLQLQRLAFFDHSNLCNHVFQYNFSSSQGHNISCANDSEKEVKPMAIEKLTIGQLEQYKASIWVLSPPCQPHTRQHSNQNQDLQDPRSRSFLHICSLLEKLTLDTLPKLIFLENVIGFEKVCFLNLYNGIYDIMTLLFHRIESIYFNICLWLEFSPIVFIDGEKYYRVGNMQWHTST